MSGLLERGRQAIARRGAAGAASAAGVRLREVVALDEAHVWYVLPLAAAPSGWLELPEGVVCVEDSVTSPDHRGRGIAPRAWSMIARSLADEGVASMVTKVGVGNAPSRRAVAKTGFVEIATMHHRRRGRRSRVVVEPAGDFPVALGLRAALQR